MKTKTLVMPGEAFVGAENAHRQDGHARLERDETRTRLGRLKWTDGGTCALRKKQNGVAGL